MSAALLVKPIPNPILNDLFGESLQPVPTLNEAEAPVPDFWVPDTK